MSQTQTIDPTLVQIVFETDVLKITWPADAVPEGYSVLVVVTDSGGAALSPAPDIQYSGTSATVSGAALVDGAQINVALSLIAPANTPTSITLQTLPQVDAPRLRFSIDGIDITWTPVSGADRYLFDVQDENGETALVPTLLDPDHPNQARIAFDDLAEKATYRIRVRAGAAHALGPWSDFTSISIDKTLPINPDLLALYQRLQSAGSSPQLGPDLVQASNITGLFTSLLGVADQTLPVENAQLSATPSSVTLQGDITLFNVTPLASTFIFTVPSAMVQMKLSVTLGSISITELQTAALAPPDIFTSDDSMNWAGELANIENALLQVDSQTGEALVTSTGDGSAWSVLGLSNATLGKVQPELQTTVLIAAEPKHYVARLTTQLDLSSNHQLNVYLQLPTGYNPWELGLREPFYVGGFADIYALFGGNRLAVPTQFESLGQLTLNQLMMRHPPQSHRWSWYVAATLTAPPAADAADAGTAPTWTIISNVLELEQLSMTLDADVYETADGFLTASAGTIGARFRLGSLTALDVLVQVPDQGGAWTLSASTSQAFQLSDTAQLLNEDETALSASMSKIGATDGFTLEQLRVSFNPDTPQITAFSVAFTIQNWTIDGLPWFTMNQIRAQLDVQNPREAAQRLIQGELSSVMTIGSVQVGVLTAFDQQAIWQVRLRAQSAQLGSLDDLSNFVSSGNVTSALPAGLPMDGGLQMAAFTMRYDSQNKYLPEATFGLEAALGWDVLPGVFYIDAIHIALQVNQAGPSSDKVVTGEVSALLGIGPAQFAVSASKPEASDPWTFKGRLTQSLHIDFASLLQTLLSTEWQLPSVYNFPTSLTIIAADATLVPSTGKFDFMGDALMEWPINFGSTTFAVVALGGSIHRAGSDGGDSSGELHGTFTIGDDIWGAASLALGTGAIDTVITVTVGDGTKLSPASLVSSISGTDNALSTPPQPSDFNPPTQFQAGIELNLTQDQFFAWGELVVGAEETNPLYGLVALQVKNLPAPTPSDNGNPAPSQSTWGFVLAAALKNFTFMRISRSLAVVDGVISVESASIMLANYAVDSTFQQQLADKLQLGDTMSLSDQVALKAGLSLYGKLTFHTTLLGNVAALLVNIDQSTLILFAHIGGQPEDTIFSAQLGNFTVFSVIHFSNLILHYQPYVDTTTTPPAEGSDQPAQTTSVLRLLADASIDFSSDGNPNKLDFKGVMTISEQKAIFKVDANLEMTLPDPLGMFGIKLEDLFLVVDHTYGADAPPTVIQLGGTVGFGTKKPDGSYPVALTANIVWVGGSPVLVNIALVQPLDLLMFFQTVFLAVPDTSDQKSYLANQSALTLLQGRIYYYKSPDGSNLVYDGTTYKPNFNLETKISLFAKNVNLAVQVLNGQTVNGLTGPQSGVIAQGSFDDPITLWFMGFYDSTFATSPALLLQVLTARKAFGLDVGLKLFSEEFATGTVTVGKTETVKDAQILAEFTYVGSINLLKYSKLVFTYSTSEGFNLTSLPFHSDVALDLAKLRQAVSALQSGCAEIVNTGFEQLIKTNFLIKPSMKDQADNKLHVTLNGIYSLSLIDNNHPFLFVDMPEITLTIALEDNLTLSRLPGYLIEQIVANSGLIIEQLISQPVKLSALISVVGAQALAKGIISNLICDMETVEESPEATEATSEAAEAAEEAAEALEAAEEAGASAAEIAELGAAAAEAAEAALAAGAAAGAGVAAAEAAAVAAAVAAGAGIGGVIGGFIGSLFGGSSDNSSGSGTHSSGNGGGSHSGDNPPPLPPKLEKVSNIQFPPVDANTLRVTWSKANDAGYYQVTVKGGAANKSQATGGVQLDFSVSDLPVGPYHVEIIAYAPNYRASDAAVSDDFWKVAPPTLKPLQLSDQTITSQIDQTQNGATSYQAQLVVNNAPAGALQTMNGTPPQAQFVISDLTATYQVQVRSMVNQGVPSGWQVSTQAIKPLSSPQLEALAYNNGQLTATLAQDVAGASGYNAQLIKDGTPVGDTVEMQPSTQQPDKRIAQFALSSDAPGANYQVRVQALGENALPSAWVTSTDGITHLSQPIIGSPTLHIGGMLINIQTTVPGAESYQARLLVDGVPQETTVDVSSAEAGNDYLASFSITETTPGTEFKVQARALGANALPSLWATGTEGVTRLASPEVQSITVDETSGNLIITFMAAIPDANNYDIQLVVDGTPASYFGSAVDTGSQPKFVIIMNPQISGTQFQVRVRATGGGHVSSMWNVSTQSLTKLDDPQFGLLGWSRNTLVARLTAAVEHAQRYESLLLIDGAASGDPVDMTPAPDNSDVPQAAFPITIDSDQPAGMVYKVQVRAFADGYLPSSYVVSDPMNRLNSPDQQPLRYANEKLIAALANTVPNAKYYQARLVMFGTPLDTMSTMQQSAQDPTQYSVEFSILNDAAGINYQVQVRAVADNFLPSIWKISTDSLTIIGVPHNVKINLIDQENTVAINWDAVSSATDYQVQITDAAGTPLVDQPDFTAKDSQNNIVTWQFAVRADFPADGIKAQVRATATNQISAWSALTEVLTLPGLDAPTNVHLAYANNTFTVTWDDASEGVDYEVQLLIGDQQTPLDPPLDAVFAGKQATIAATAVAGGSSVSARVRAKGTQSRNVLKNGDATDGFNNWQILANGGNQWQIEDGPAASCPGTEGNTNFVTSYQWDKKAQTIDLLAEGLAAAYLDSVPDIEISEWMCSRSDCVGQYQLVVELRDAGQKVIQRFDTGVINAPIAPNWVYPWEKISHLFSAYGAGVRFVYFEHSGKDVNGWAGHYGAKMTGGRVMIKTPLTDSVKMSDWSPVSNAVTTQAAGAAAKLAIVSGNNQSVARTNPIEIPGGQAHFDQLQVRVTDANDIPVAEAKVSFAAAGPPEMAIQLEPSGGSKTVTATTDASGIATLNAMFGDSVICYYAEGAFTVTASLNNLSQTFNLTVAPTPARPAYPGAVLTLVSGDKQSVARVRGSVSGGQAKFAPLQIRLTDAQGSILPDVLVDFNPGTYPEGMAVQVHPSGATPATVKTDSQGIATLNEMPDGMSVYAYYEAGAFTVVASVAGGATATFNLTVSS